MSHASQFKRDHYLNAYKLFYAYGARRARCGRLTQQPVLASFTDAAFVGGTPKATYLWGEKRGGMSWARLTSTHIIYCTVILTNDHWHAGISPVPAVIYIPVITGTQTCLLLFFFIFSQSLKYLCSDIFFTTFIDNLFLFVYIFIPFFQLRHKTTCGQDITTR